MAQSLHKHLKKDDIKRHFPEKNGGKGDLRFRGRRGAQATAEELRNFRANYDNIDWSKK